MAIPVIDLTTSILEPTVGVPFSYIPFASDSPTGWSAATLPSGLAINAITGEISGTPTVAGVCVSALIARNAEGSSNPSTKIVFGVAPGAPAGSVDHTNPALLGMNCIIDVTSGSVSFPGAVAAAKTDANTESAKLGGSDGDSAATASPACSIIEGDDVLLYTQFSKNGRFVDQGSVGANDLEIALKEFEPDSALVIGNTHIKNGSGEDATYILYVRAESADLAGALSNYEDDSSTHFTAVAQIRWKVPNTTGIGPDPLVRSSQLFRIQIVRNVAP